MFYLQTFSPRWGHFSNLFFFLHLKKSPRLWKWKHPVELNSIMILFPAISLAVYSTGEQSEIRWCGMSEKSLFFINCIKFVIFIHEKRRFAERWKKIFAIVCLCVRSGGRWVYHKKACNRFLCVPPRKRKNIVEMLSWPKARLCVMEEPFSAATVCAYGEALITVYETII